MFHTVAHLSIPPRPATTGRPFVERPGRVVLICLKRFGVVMLKNFRVIRQYSAENILKSIGLSGIIGHVVVDDMADECQVENVYWI